MTKKAIEDAHKAGIRVVVWTVNEPRDIARLVDWRVDGIISDYPDRVIEETKKR
jgi:glycerophosphoryl diester phosphodiesterase